MNYQIHKKATPKPPSKDVFILTQPMYESINNPIHGQFFENRRLENIDSVKQIRSEKSSHSAPLKSQQQELRNSLIEKNTPDSATPEEQDKIRNDQKDKVFNGEEHDTPEIKASKQNVKDYTNFLETGGATNAMHNDFATQTKLCATKSGPALNARLATSHVFAALQSNPQAINQLASALSDSPSAETKQITQAFNKGDLTKLKQTLEQYLVEHHDQDTPLMTFADDAKSFNQAQKSSTKLQRESADRKEQLTRQQKVYEQHAENNEEVLKKTVGKQITEN